MVVEAETLHKQVDRHAYGPPTFRFAEQDVDQARAAGVLVEFPSDRGYGATSPIITDKAVYRELAKQVIPRTLEDLQARLAAKQTRKTSGKTRVGAANVERTPRENLDTEHRAELRDLTLRAHGVNLDLGAALLRDLASVAPDSLEVAKFVCYGLLGPDSGSYLGTSDHAADDRRERAAARARGAPHDHHPDVEERQTRPHQGRLR